MLIGKAQSLFLVVCLLSTSAPAQEARLEHGKPVERQIAGGESHTYQMTLQAGQFVRFRLEQRAIDAGLILTAPDGKQLIEMNLDRAGEQSLSWESPAASSYRLTVRASGTSQRGSYRLEASVHATATAEDRKRLRAEALLVETNELSKQAGRTAQQVIEKSQEALPILRELGEPGRTAWTLRRIGIAYFNLGQFEKSIEYREQALAIYRELKDRANEAEGINGLGYANVSLGRFEKAVDSFEQALAIYREANNRAGVGDSLYSLGAANVFLSRHEKAVEYLGQALAIYRELKNRRVKDSL